MRIDGVRIGSRWRFPDGLTENVLSEIKNCARLRMTPQLRAYLNWAESRATPFRFDLYVRAGRGTELIGELNDLVAVGRINVIRVIPYVR